MSRVVALCDDPAGSQAAADVTVMLDPLAEPPAGDPAFVLTGTRAMAEAGAVRLLGRVREVHGAADYVLCGDAALRGHVFAEADAFGAAGGVLLFVPAYPAAGRIVDGGVPYVSVDGCEIVAADTEFAADPVFGYSARTMAGWVREKGGRPAVEVPMHRLGALADVLSDVPAGTVVVPDAVSDGDLESISTALDLAQAGGRRVVLRCAPPLAAIRAGRLARYPLRPPAVPGGGTLVVCTSHSWASAHQVGALAQRLGAKVRTVSAAAARVDAAAEGSRLAAALAADLDRAGTAILAAERVRRSERGAVLDGGPPTAALTAAVAGVASRLRLVIVKGGGASVRVARDGLGADRARVLGPLLPGVAVWRAEPVAAPPLLYTVMSDEVGDARSLVDVADAFGLLT